MPDFRPCSTRLSHSQAPLCHCTLRLISAQAEGTFGRLRYFLGGDRPSQTTRQALSGTPISAPVKLPARHCPEPRSGAPLELKFSEAGIPLLAPPELTPELHSLPAILYTLNPSPMPRCSKAPRGLSVLPRVTCIFTGIAVSPSICPRQRPTRYAIRAGRNFVTLRHYWRH